jgi:nucleoside-triphosphatase THEP1
MSSSRQGPDTGCARVPLVILSGESGCGKTTLCLEAARWARERGLSVAGLITLPHLVAGRKATLEAQDVRSGETRTFGRYVDISGDPIIQHWQFCAEAIAWGKRVLAQACPCDVLIIDELGPLELVHGKGWRSALAVLRQQRYRLALVSVRPLLLPNLLHQLVGVPAVALGVDTDERGAAHSRLRRWIEALHDSD